MTSLEFLYDTVPGRILLKCLIHPCVSQACGHFLDSSLSGFLITPFARKNQIILSDYQLDDIHSFNDFFSRKIKPSLRPVDMDPKSLIAPCDGLLSVWKIQKDTVLPIKQSSYTLTDLLRDVGSGFFQRSVGLHVFFKPAAFQLHWVDVHPGRQLPVPVCKKRSASTGVVKTEQLCPLAGTYFCMFKTIWSYIVHIVCLS